MDHHEHNHHMNHSEHGGHDKHAGHNPDMFKQKFWLSLLFTLPVLDFSQTKIPGFRMRQIPAAHR